MRLFELIGLGVVVAGWAATHFLSEARERRKETRGQIEKFIDRLQALEIVVRDFHTAEAFSSSKTLALIADLDRIERSLSRIGILDIDGFTPAIIFLRRSVTLKNFDASSFKTQTQDSEILEDVGTSCQDVEDEIERQYRYRYPSAFPYFRRPWQ